MPVVLTSRPRAALAGGLVLLAVLGGGAVAAGASSPTSPSAVERTAEQDERGPDRGRRPAPPDAPAFVCDPSRSHGQNVSAYARSLPKGPGRGQLVSQAARSDCGKKADD